MVLAIQVLVQVVTVVTTLGAGLTLITIRRDVVSDVRLVFLLAKHARGLVLSQTTGAHVPAAPVTTVLLMAWTIPI